MSVESWASLTIVTSKHECLLHKVGTTLIGSVVNLCVSAGAMYLMVIDSWCLGIIYSSIFFRLFLIDDYYLHECTACMTIFIIDIGISANYLGLMSAHILHDGHDDIHKYYNNLKYRRSMALSCIFVHLIISGIAFFLQLLTLYIFWPVIKVLLSSVSLALMKINCNPRICFDADNIITYIEYWLLYQPNYGKECCHCDCDCGGRWLHIFFFFTLILFRDQLIMKTFKRLNLSIFHCPTISFRLPLNLDTVSLVHYPPSKHWIKWYLKSSNTSILPSICCNTIVVFIRTHPECIITKFLNFKNCKNFIELDNNDYNTKIDNTCTTQQRWIVALSNRGTKHYAWISRCNNCNYLNKCDITSKIHNFRVSMNRLYSKSDKGKHAKLPVCLCYGHMDQDIKLQDLSGTEDVFKCCKIYYTSYKYKECNYCHKKAKHGKERFKWCKGCNKVMYCSRKCQKLDWKENDHKIVCVYLRE